MQDLDRRSALAFGITTVSTLVLPHAAEAGMSGMSGSSAMSGAAEGKEIGPGVRRIDYGQRESMIPAYKTVAMRDIVFQPGASHTVPSMANDMVCHMLEGELTINQGPGMDFVAKKGDVWTCKTGVPETSKNTGSTVAIMRITDLLA
jgi:hypothetical protein